VALAGVMRTLDSDVAMMDNCVENLPLFAPEELAEAVAHPTDRITDVRVLWWVEQVCKNGPFGG
jgi:hypothetical protein